MNEDRLMSDEKYQRAERIIHVEDPQQIIGRINERLYTLQEYLNKALAQDDISPEIVQIHLSMIQRHTVQLQTSVLEMQKGYQSALRDKRNFGGTTILGPE